MSASGGQSKRAKAARQAKSKQLNKKYRHEAAQLKRLGILSNRVNARSNISRSTKTKINKFRGVLEGREIAVKAPKEIRQKYTEKGVLEERGSFLIAPKQFKNQKGRIQRGLVQITRPLKVGQEEYVILPFNAADMPELVRRLKEDESLDGLKQWNEFFSFRLEGWNAHAAFINMEELGDYIETRYQHLFKPDASQKAVKFFTFQRFRTKHNRIPEENPHESREPKTAYPRKDRKDERYGTAYQMRMKRLAARKRKQRANETEQERKTRLEKQRIRSARNRQAKLFED